VGRLLTFSMINPYPMLAALRERAPVHRVEPQGWWAVSRYEDVMFALRNPEIFSSETGLERRAISAGVARSGY